MHPGPEVAPAGYAERLERVLGVAPRDGHRETLLRAAAAMEAHVERDGGTGPDAEQVAAERALAEMALEVRSYADVVAVITGVLAPLYDCASAGLAIWHDERRYLELQPGSFGAPDDAVAGARVAPSNGPSLPERAVSQRCPVYSNDLRADLPSSHDTLSALGVEQLLAAPLLAPQGRIAGALHLANHRTGFGDDDVARIRTALPAVTAMVDRVRGRHVRREREALSTVVARLATAIAYGQPLSRLTRLLGEFCAGLRAQMLVHTFQDGRPMLQVRVEHVGPTVADAFMTAATTSTMALRTTTRPPRGGDDPGYSALHTPVLVGGDLGGTLSLLRVPYEPFVAHEREAVQRLAEVTSLAHTTDKYHRFHAEVVRHRERQRIADDLHDHVAQILYSGQLAVQSALERLEPDSAAETSLVRARELLVRGQAAVRETIEQLPRLGEISVASRLASVVHEVEDEFERLIALDVAADAAIEAKQLTTAESGVLLAVAREGAVNAAKHAGPCDIRVALSLQPEARLLLTVEDNGQGADGDAGMGYGLTALRRRVHAQGGALRFGSGTQGGAQLAVSFPLQSLITGT